MRLEKGEIASTWSGKHGCIDFLQTCGCTADNAIWNEWTNTSPNITILFPQKNDTVLFRFHPKHVAAGCAESEYQI